MEDAPSDSSAEVKEAAVLVFSAALDNNWEVTCSNTADRNTDASADIPGAPLDCNDFAIVSRSRCSMTVVGYNICLLFFLLLLLLLLLLLIEILGG
jgi:hypothetical protein